MRYAGHRPIWLVLAVAWMFLPRILADATEAQSGTVSIETTAVAAGIGVEWGDGRLILNDGRQFRFSVRGLELGGIGYAKVSAHGKIYDLKDLDDFAGLYIAGKAGIALGNGPGVLVMHNERGVVIDMQAVQEGAKLTIGPQGIQIAMK